MRVYYNEHQPSFWRNFFGATIAMRLGGIFWNLLVFLRYDSVKIGPVEKMAKEKLDKIITRTEEAGRNVR